METFCEYCGGQHEEGRRECPGCGAPKTMKSPQREIPFNGFWGTPSYTAYTLGGAELMTNTMSVSTHAPMISLRDSIYG